MDTMIASRCTKIKWFVVIVLVLCLASWGGSSVFAGNARPCDSDVAKFCKDVQPGGGGIIQCLKDHKNDVSAGCKEDLSKMPMNPAAFMEACRDNVLKFCKDIKPGEGRIVQCLKGHENELSPQCKAGLPPQR
jgi:hypothetical protein